MNKTPDKITFSATIPVAQYANIAPTIEMSGVTIEEAEATGLNYIKELFARFSSLGELKDKDITSIKVVEKKNLGMKESQ